MFNRVAKCPNHNEWLMGIESPVPKKGVGKCPVSGVDFEFEADPNEVEYARTASGDIIKQPKMKVTGND